MAAYTSFLDNTISKELHEDQQLDQSQDDPDENTILTDLTLEAVVYSPSIPLNQALFLVYKLEEPVLILSFPFVDTPRPLISYLVNTFCRIIAINAP